MFATMCDNIGHLPGELTISKPTAASRRLPFFVRRLSSRDGSAGVSYLPMWLGARGLGYAVCVPLYEQQMLVDCAACVEMIPMS